MGEPTTRERLEQELAAAREQRRQLADQLAGEDPEDPDPGDRGDASVQLEGEADLSRMDQRIEELERLLADPDALETPPGLPDGTVVTLRFPDGGEATLRFVAIPAGAQAGDQDDVVTAESPLSQALIGQSAGDTI